MTKRLYISSLVMVTYLIAMLLACNNSSTQQPVQVIPKHIPTLDSGIYIDLKETIGKKNNHDSAVLVNITYDHYFKKSKKYKGYLLSKLIDAIIKTENFDTSNSIVIFECIDGYKPNMDISKIFGKIKGFIVYKDMDKNDKGNWPDSIKTKFEPYYLVWDNVKKDDDSFAWPYGLVGIRLIKMDKAYKPIYPFENTLLINGFNLFRNNCMKCHSINKIGGSMGPDFNLPKNITEYWKENDILAFVKKPSSYRYNSGMPPIANINDAEIKEIIAYIKSIKNNKSTL